MIHISMHGPLPRAVSREALTRAIREVFRVTRHRLSGGVDVAFVTDQKIASLNAAYRGYRRPTDVLSFSPPPTTNDMRRATRDSYHWGEIVVASAYAKKEAARRNVPFGEEILRLVVHGMLHLFGYDHATDREEKRMFGIQERIVARFSRAL